jgi:endonuclease V-like protein UPF0215 family
MKVYTVDAFRYGDRENHSYLVGVYSTKEKAEKTAKQEEIHRGGKYECEILEWDLDRKEYTKEIKKADYDFTKYIKKE